MKRENILKIADKHFYDRQTNTLPTKTFMGVDEELLRFAQEIIDETVIECGGVVENIREQGVICRQQHLFDRFAIGLNHADR